MRTRIANAVAGMAVAVVAGCSATPPSPSQGPVQTPSSLPSGVAAGSAPPTAGPTSSAAPDYELAYGNPQPVDVTVQLSAITFTTPVTTEHGGFLALAGADGTFYQLDIPPNSVLSDVDVTMTVVASIGGSPLGDQLVGAVDLEPAGLTFLTPASLTITPISPVAQDAEGPFTADSGGRDFHLYPLDPDPTVLRMPITHFSLFGLFLTDAERRAALVKRTAGTVGKQLEQEMSTLVDQARKAKGNIDVSKAEAVFSTYSDRVVRPMVALARSDHTLFMQAFKRWVSWEKQRGLLLGDTELDANLLDMVRKGFANYAEHTKDRCYAHDFGAIHDFWTLARQDELQNGLLQGPEQADAAEFMDKCLTFTLEMESTMQYDIRTCMFIDLGASRATGSVSVKASVEIQRLQGGPWIGAMSWGSAQGHADCKLPAKGGGNIIECTIDVTGTGDPGVFTVNEFNVDLNDVNRPPPPPPPTPKPSVPATGSPTPVASPSGPPTPAPTEAPEYTITELRFRDLLVQPGDPQIVYDNNCQFFGIPGTTADHGSSHWLAGWTDNSQPVGRQFINQPPFGEAYRLANWELVMDGDVLARREYEGGVTGLVGTTHEKTSFVIRHTPRR